MAPTTPGFVDEDGVLWKSTRVDSFQSEPVENVKSLWELVAWRVANTPLKQGVGWREVLTREDEPQPGGRVFEKVTLGPFNWMSYASFQATVEGTAAGLIPRTALKPKDKIMIFAETSKEWMVMAAAAWRQNVTVCTAYATLGVQGLQFGINQTKCSIVVTDAKLLKVLSLAAPGCPTLKHVVCLSDVSRFPQAAAFREMGITTHTLKEIIATGTQKPVVREATSAEDLVRCFFSMPLRVVVGGGG